MRKGIRISICMVSRHQLYYLYFIWTTICQSRLCVALQVKIWLWYIWFCDLANRIPSSRTRFSENWRTVTLNWMTCSERLTSEFRPKGVIVNLITYQLQFVSQCNSKKRYLISYIYIYTYLTYYWVSIIFVKVT